MTEQGPRLTSSGRCHGPGCGEATNSDFCSVSCLDRWDEQFGAYREAMDRAAAALASQAGIDPRLLASRSATYPQVASENPQVASNPDPQVGLLPNLFRRLFGRTT